MGTSLGTFSESTEKVKGICVPGDAALSGLLMCSRGEPLSLRACGSRRGRKVASPADVCQKRTPSIAYRRTKKDLEPEMFSDPRSYARGSFLSPFPRGFRLRIYGEESEKDYVFYSYSTM